MFTLSSAYLFAIAAILASISILLIFKINVEKIKENPENLSNVQTKFFIGVAIAEIIPIILIIFGMINLESASSLEELLIPGIIAISAMVFAPLFILLQRSIGVPEEAKQNVTTFAMIALAMANAIPLIALVGLIMMLP
ncbi:hypothetical protein [Ornithinibacillus sp. 179-J 7C1 HS]|uniref:hypothetical protein n=1 Tax=Ornithinibacillus sp. 179-J 7C1 HS TaxID=3142384 RepID=UPI0039A10921